MSCRAGKPPGCRPRAPPRRRGPGSSSSADDFEAVSTSPQRLRRRGAGRRPRRERYLTLKLEGIVDARLKLCVTCDRRRFGPAALGRNTLVDADLFSVVTAVRAEGVAVGWVRGLRNEFLTELLELPDHIVPVAYLRVGDTDEFPERPTLETAGWSGSTATSDLYGV